MGDNCLHEHRVQSLSVQGNRKMASRCWLCPGLLHIRNYRRGEAWGRGALSLKEAPAARGPWGSLSSDLRPLG